MSRYNWNCLVHQLYRPVDCAGLAFNRIILGILLLIDIVNERGLSRADILWIDETNKFQCHFPLFQWLQRFEHTESMYAVYLIMVIGVKKTNLDWLNGYSMVSLSTHWIWSFAIDYLHIPNHWIDYFVIHVGGFVFDSSVGFMFLFSATRPIGFLLAIAFNLINSQMFQIGMFPFVMIMVMPIFLSPNWPRKVVNRIHNSGLLKSFQNWKMLNQLKLNNDELLLNKSKKYRKQISKMDGLEANSKLKWNQHLTIIIIMIYIALQMVLPFAYPFLKGYNTWTNGLYGYSWDMMIHNWNHVHTRVTVRFSPIDGNGSIETYYINPDEWTVTGRWSHHADMVVQFAHCVEQRLRSKLMRDNLTMEMYFDVWTSLNGRFAQRMYDPTTNILNVKWTPFTKLEWILPILHQSEEWRSRLEYLNLQLENHIIQSNGRQMLNDSYMIYITDFPGLSLNNYIDETLFQDQRSPILFLLDGFVHITFSNGSEFLLKSSPNFNHHSISLPIGQLSTVTTIGRTPSYYSIWYPKKSPMVNRRTMSIMLYQMTSIGKKQNE
ncbi:hypothetical protein RDWZM_007933 [Blomia tropicalis]|uniref:HTTM-like domain-containing protein n=1 Tax=Blomia tropicalis TaxID=40697 RepID=A0A9Q0RKX7_BLOTA|nr:hypothetical protein RDWZM_007933 [Blomia tropicalis]